METKTAKLTLESITTALDESQKARFFDVFWKAWTANGFGTLGKKDTELLIFACLKQAFEKEGQENENRPENNYEWARLLRLTPSKIKSMRLEAHLRFGHLVGENTVIEGSRFLSNFHQVQSIDFEIVKTNEDISELTVSFVIEDPVAQMEIENRLKAKGSYLDFHRNREVVKMKLLTFFLLITDDIKKEKIDEWVAQKAKEKAETSSLIKRVLGKEYANKSEAGKIMAFGDDLAKFAKAESLTKHLKTIFKSQSEREK